MAIWQEEEDARTVWVEMFYPWFWIIWVMIAQIDAFEISPTHGFFMVCLSGLTIAILTFMSERATWRHFVLALWLCFIYPMIVMMRLRSYFEYRLHG